MIRRDADYHWLLISQLEHARIAAELAEAWDDPQLTAFPRRSELLSAIRHHDDGWAAWELAPTTNEQGEPRGFTEMPMPEATAIWARSVEVCASRSAFGGLCVSRHFCYLAQRAFESRDSIADLNAIDRFLFQQALKQERRREELDAVMRDVPSVEESGFLWLQAFDRISLWLCCAERTESWTLTLPRGNAATFRPLHSGEIAVEPSPFRGPIRLGVEAVRLPRETFQKDDELAIGQLPRQTIEWQLIPNPG